MIKAGCTDDLKGVADHKIGVIINKYTSRNFKDKLF